jgi:hypothetical protein
MTKPLSRRARALKAGYRSGLEETVAKQIAAMGVTVEYETKKIHFLQPSQARTYTPDFYLPNGIIVETKGRFLPEDRKKHLWIQEQYPNLDIRFVFTNPHGKLYKGSPTTYAKWCDKHGFTYAKSLIPNEWFSEPSRGTL